MPSDIQLVFGLSVALLPVIIGVGLAIVLFLPGFSRRH